MRGFRYDELEKDRAYSQTWLERSTVARMIYTPIKTGIPKDPLSKPRGASVPRG